MNKRIIQIQEGLIDKLCKYNVGGYDLKFKDHGLQRYDIDLEIGRPFDYKRLVDIFGDSNTISSHRLGDIGCFDWLFRNLEIDAKSYYRNRVDTLENRLFNYNGSIVISNREYQLDRQSRNNRQSGITKVKIKWDNVSNR